MAITLTGNDGVVFTFDEGSIASEDMDVTGSPEQIGQFNSGPMGAYVYDREGATAIILLTGRLYDAATTRTSSGTTTTKKQQTDWLMKQINGAQRPRSYQSDLVTTLWSRTGQSSVTVLASRIRVSRNENDGPDQWSFTIALLVGTDT